MGSYTLIRAQRRARPALDELFRPGEGADDELHELEAQVRRLERKLQAVMASPALDAASVRAAISHTRLVCLPAGYRLVEVDDPPPALDESVEHDGNPYTVWRLTPSSFPGDPRRCAVLMPA